MVQATFKIKDNKIIGIEVKVETQVNKFKPKKCGYCGKIFNPTHPHNLYCSETCRYYSDLEHTNERKRRYRKRYHGENDDRAILNVGTGELGPHRRQNFQEELEAIQKEIKNLRLKVEGA